MYYLILYLYISYCIYWLVVAGYVLCYTITEEQLQNKKKYIYWLKTDIFVVHQQKLKIHSN